MKIQNQSSFCNKLFFIAIFVVFAQSKAFSQQTQIKDFVVFGGKVEAGQSVPLSPGYAVQLGSSSSITGGSIGSYHFIKSTGNANFGTTTLPVNLFSGGTIQLSNSNVVTGRITAANAAAAAGTILNIGSSANIAGNIDVNGNIIIGGGIISGKVTHPIGTTYVGPVPAGGNMTGLPNLPVLPQMPAIISFPDTLVSSQNITTTRIISPDTINNLPGIFGHVLLGGNKTLTLKGPGVYVFKSIRNTGTSNHFIFDFQGKQGIIKIYVHGDVDLGKVKTSFIGASPGAESRVYLETHGKGASATDPVSFKIANGSAGNASKWIGTVWAPFAAINVGSGTGVTNISGALWSGTQVIVQSGVSINFSPLQDDDVIFPFNPITSFKVATVIGAELTSLTLGVSNEAKKLLVILNGYVLIDVISLIGHEAEVRSLLLSEGMIDTVPNGVNSLIITGKFPIANLLHLNSRGDIIDFCRPVYAPIENSGLIKNAGDTALGSYLARNGFNLHGTGIKIGVLSDSYNSLATPTNDPALNDVGSGDLPGIGNPNNPTPVQVLQDYPYFPRSDEGRAMLQTIHDIADKALLAFRTGFISQGDFAVGIKQLQEAGCDIIVDDIIYINEPFLQDGTVAKTIDLVKSLGVSYFTSAGNFGSKSSGQTFRPVAPPAGFPTGTTAHDFSGNGDIYQRIKLKPGTYTIALQWEDDFYSMGQTQNGGAINDLDIYITNPDGKIVAGFNRDNRFGDPFEFLAYTVSGAVAETEANILITKANTGTPGLQFKFIIFRGDAVIMEYQNNSSTIVGHSNAAGAITVGAINYFKTPAFTTATPVVAPYSSVGGTLINRTENRNKPDMIAPDGINTSVNMGPDYSGDADPFSNFFGTSVAAPQAAAVAALIIEARRRFLNENPTPGVIKSLLQGSALPVGTPATAGAGLIQADITMRTFAAPTPSIHSLEYPADITPATPPTTSFTLYVNGDYLAQESQILFRGVAVPTNYESTQKISAIIQSFSGNPSIQVFTPPKANGDGGLSNTINFFSVPKKRITVTADAKSKKYGELIPAFTSSVLVDSIPLAQSGLTLQELGLQNITYNTNANPLSNVGNQYFIKPVRTFDLTNSTDVGLLELYNYDTIPGILTIEKLPVVVTPNDQSLPYGHYPANITFSYQFDNSNMADPAAILNIIKSSHENHLPDNALAVIANGNSLSDANLSNLSAMASFQSIVNARKFQLIDDRLSPVTNHNSFNLVYLVDIAMQSILDYRTNMPTSNLIEPFIPIHPRAMLNAAILSNGNSQVILNGNLVQMVNGNLVQMVNGSLGQQLPIVNGNLVQLVNGNLVQLVNGEWVPIPNTLPVHLLNGNLVQFVNNEWLVIPNGNLVQLVNGTLVQMVNGNLVQMVNGNLVQIVNGNLVQIVNGNLVQLVNGTLVPVANGTLVQLVNGNLVQLVNGNLVQMVNGALIPLDSGVQIINGNLVIVNATNQDPLTNNAGVIIDLADATDNGFIGVMSSVNMITGLSAGVQRLVAGTLKNDNLAVTYGIGQLTISQDSACLITRNPFNNFGSTPSPQQPTSLWVNVETKISGQLKTPGRYLLFTGGSISFKDINAKDPVTNLPITSAEIPNGKIIADTVSAPVTHFDMASNTWVTRVPVGYNSTSDIFITGAIINSSEGFVKKKNNANSSTTVSGIFYCDTTLSDQWTYALATYRPVFDYAAIADTGQVISVNGTYRAGTPVPFIGVTDPQLTHLVNGGSGGGGNNYTGSTSSFDNFTACSANATTGSFTVANLSARSSIVQTDNVEIQEVNIEDNKAILPGEFQITPNPASASFVLSFTPACTGRVKIIFTTIDGMKVYETDMGLCEAGKKYRKQVDAGKLINGLYLVQLYNNGSKLVKKMIISH